MSSGSGHVPQDVIYQPIQQMERPVSAPMDTCSRRPHRKSRNGCSRCKKRKVKCDEKHPACSNCIKHSVQCDFLLQESTSPRPASRPGPSDGYVSAYGPSPYSNPRTPGATASHPPSPHQQVESPLNTHNGFSQVSAINMLDMELLHNFCTSTCYTFHNDPILKTLWRVNVPQLAFSFDFVMRGILAISALHLAHYKPDRREFYLNQATAQHQAGLRQATQLLRNVTAENCTPVYIFTAMTCMFTLASPRKEDDFLVISDGGIAEWLILFRGTRSIIEPWNDTLRDGPLGPMFIAGTRRSQHRDNIEHPPTTEEGDQLNELCEHIKSTVQNPDLLPIYLNAIEELRKSFSFIYKTRPTKFESEDMFGWLFGVSDEYLMLLREWTQEALVIFAYYCVIPKRLEANWWIEGWSTHLMTRLYPMLDEEHRLWIRWPIEETGWVPN